MSIRSEKSDEDFREWKRDLLDRASLWSKEHPEAVPVVTRPVHPKVNPTNPSNKPFVMPNTIVRVLESILSNGVWNVWKDNQLIGSFAGPMAQVNATSLANEILDHDKNGNTQSVSTSSPTICVFCGGRYSHRTDCPDLKKDGPTME